MANRASIVCPPGGPIPAGRFIDKEGYALRETSDSTGRITNNGPIFPPNDFTGRWFDWHLNGAIATDMYFKNGKANGLAIFWHENGLKQAEFVFVDDFGDGLVIEWHENGRIHKQTEMCNRRRHGMRRVWNSSGNLISNEFYANGKLVVPPPPAPRKRNNTPEWGKPHPAAD